MTTRIRFAAALSVIAVVALAAGCASGPSSDSPTSSAAPSSVPSSSTDGSGDDGLDDDMGGTILDDGRAFAVVTWGSSSCAPMVADVTGEGQTVTVTLTDGDDADRVCTADYAARASIGTLPEGVDPTQDITLQVTYGDVADDVDLDGDVAFAGVPGSPTEYAPSAGWVDDGTLVLLTWGSSSCPPVVESLEGSGTSGTATFVTDDAQVCTMDMAPRATLLAFPDDSVDDDDFTLTLVGGGLDGTVTVRG